MHIIYLVEGRQTERCWYDEKQPTHIQGDFESVERCSNLDGVLAEMTRYFAACSASSGDADRFVTVTEIAPTGYPLGQRMFTVSDVLGDRSAAAGEALRVGQTLLDNGRRRGRKPRR